MRRALRPRPPGLAPLLSLWLPLLAVACGGGQETRDAGAAPVDLLPPLASLVALPGGFHVGADVSFLQEMEALGQPYLDERGAPADALAVLRDHGVTTIRLRVWNAPPAGYCDVAHTVAMARRVRAAGLHLLLDFHYSDHWADPGHQDKPAAWAALDGDALAQAVFDFSRDTVAALYAAGAPPDLVQVGNEITAGMLWPDGHLDWSLPSWARLAALVEAGARGSLAGAGTSAPPRIVVHIDRGGDAAGARAFFIGLVDAGVPFDAIGLSYYPWWHGSLDALAATLDDLALRFFRDVLVVETSYPWTAMAATPDGNTVWKADQLLPAFAPTKDGQRAYLAQLLATVRARGGKGAFWWAPEWLPQRGESQPTAGFETLTLFDESGAPLPAQAALALP